MDYDEIGFGDWFEEQCGGRPGGYFEQDAELLKRVRDGRHAKRLLNKRREWDRMRTAALWAWQVRREGDDG